MRASIIVYRYIHPSTRFVAYVSPTYVHHTPNACMYIHTLFNSIYIYSKLYTCTIVNISSITWSALHLLLPFICRARAHNGQASHISGTIPLPLETKSSNFNRPRIWVSLN